MLLPLVTALMAPPLEAIDTLPEPASTRLRLISLLACNTTAPPPDEMLAAGLMLSDVGGSISTAPPTVDTTSLMARDWPDCI